MKVRYPYLTDAQEASTRSIVLGLVGTYPDSMQVVPCPKIKRRKKVLIWNGLTPDESERACKLIRTNLSHPNPKQHVEVEV